MPQKYSGSKTAKPKTTKQTKYDGSKTAKPKKVNKKDETVIRWKIIPTHENYEVSNFGNVRNIETGYVLKNCVKMGYHYCSMTKEGSTKKHRVHRLVAISFIKNPNKYPIVNHIDGNKLNNHYKNLEWTTSSGNNQHAADTGLVKTLKRRVAQYVGEELVQEFDSLQEAQKSTGTYMSRIVEVCKGQREEYKGYVWKYMDVNINEKIVDLVAENFKQVKTFPNYWINNKGQVYSKPTKKFMKIGTHGTGCTQIQLSRIHPSGSGQIKKTVLIHNLVAMYFLKKPKKGNYNYIGHKNEVKSDNCVENLEWRFKNGVKTDFSV